MIFYFTAFVSYIWAVNSTITTNAKYVLIISQNQQKVLFNKNETAKLYPASITKLMTLYITFRRIQDKQLSLQDTAIVSNNAFKKGNVKTGGSTMFLNAGQSVSVEDLVKGIIVSSGNDAAITLSELIAGSEEQFVNLMNNMAKELKLTGTHFANVDGIHNPKHYSTAEDLTYLSYLIIKDFPQYYAYFNDLEFSFNNIKQPNRNLLLNTKFPLNNIVVDGLKTGHTDISKYSIAFSAINNNNMRITGIVSGVKTQAERLSETKKLIQWVFDNFDQKLIYHKGEKIIEIPVNIGSESSIILRAKEDIYSIYSKFAKIKSNAEVVITAPQYLVAPVNEGDKIATLKITTEDPRFNIEIPLFAETTIAQRSIVLRVVFAPYYALRKLLN
jgi:D-alanyl-D-alanine carboxypeptidase (penicillin-binding protein 5/6)